MRGTAKAKLEARAGLARRDFEREKTMHHVPLAISALLLVGLSLCFESERKGVIVGAMACLVAFWGAYIRYG